jgi:hypothetical protein
MVERGPYVSYANCGLPYHVSGVIPQESSLLVAKDELDDALGDLNRSTNRLRRKFDAIDTWMETKSEVQSVVDDGRGINQVVARGNYGAEAARLWAVLRGGIDHLARAY